MDREVPAYLGVGVDDDMPVLDNYFCSSNDREPLELLLRGVGGGAGGSSGVHEPPSLMIDLPDPPPPLPTHCTAGNPSGEGVPDSPTVAEMASWLGQVFEHEPRRAGTATTIKYEGGNAVPGSGGGHLRTACAGVPAGGGAECRRGPSSSGRRRSCSGKAAEQRRRHKISDKLSTLQEMLPSCSKGKTDQASTLEEVIKYVKSLQHQVQVMSANGYALPTPIWPVGVMPPAWTQLRAGGGQAPVMLTQYPVSPTVYACDPRHGTRLPLSVPYTRRHPAAEPAGSGGRQLLAPRRPLVRNDLTMPTHSASCRK